MKLAAFLVGVFLSFSVYAESIGSVTELSGTAFIVRSKNTINVSLGTLIHLNDKIETKSGKLKITFNDDTTIKITESSSLVIDDFIYDRNRKSDKLSFKVTTGTIRYVSGNIAHNNPSSVKIRTPTSTVSVRGTDFIISVDEAGSTLAVLMPSCESTPGINSGQACGSGKIDVDTNAGRVSLDRPYQTTHVETGDKMPSHPITVNLTDAPMSNNLILSPPRTSTGVNVITLARAAAQKTGDSDGQATILDPEPTLPIQREEKAMPTAQIIKNDGQAIIIEPIVTLTKATTVESVEDTAQTVSVTDKGFFQQTTSFVERLSSSGHNYLMLVSPDSKAALIIKQDSIIDISNNINAKGTITVNQVYK